MTRLILTAAAVLALSECAPARAQFACGPVYPYGYGGGYSYSYSYRSGFGFAFGGPRFRVGGFYGGFVTRSAFYAPPVFAAPFGPIGYGFGYPYWGGYGPVAPPVIAVPVAVPVVVGGNFAGPNGDGVAGIAPPPEDAVLFPKGADERDFLVIAPRRNETNPPVRRVAAAPRPPGPAFKFDPFKKAVPVKAEIADADPKTEAARLVKLGRASFAAGDYGRAAEHFERAATADPDAALAHFLHAQARFAAGQYADAVTRIRAGLARDPKWPTTAFDPIELYGDRPELFVVHLIALKKTVAANPKRATLEFLLGYELWFSEEKAEADKLFRAAEKRLAAPGPIALFELP